MKILITLFNTKLLKFQKLINCDSFKSFTKGLVLGLQFFELILLTKLFLLKCFILYEYDFKTLNKLFKIFFL